MTECLESTTNININPGLFSYICGITLFLLTASLENGLYNPQVKPILIKNWIQKVFSTITTVNAYVDTTTLN